MSLERNIKFNDDNSITIDGIKYIPESKTDCNKNIESEKRCTGIDSPGTYDTIYYVNKHGELKRHPYSWEKFYKPYLRGRVVKDAILSLSRDKATQIRFALEKYAAEHNAEPLDWTDDNSWKYRIAYNSNTKMLEAYSCIFYKHDTVYFDSAKTAKNAIKAVGEEDVLWLHRDYQPYLNAFKMD